MAFSESYGAGQIEDDGGVELAGGAMQIFDALLSVIPVRHACPLWRGGESIFSTSVTLNEYKTSGPKGH